MRKLSAHYIFPVYRPPLKYGIIVLDDDNRVVDLIDTGGVMKEEANLEFYSGIIVPGFVNAHCHLELSHLFNVIPAKTGISSFVEKVTQERASKEEVRDKWIKTQAAEMYLSGTSVVGDIVNTSDTISAKLKSPVYWHSFIELFGLKSMDAEMIWKRGKQLEALFRENRLASGLSPHAPYSVSRELWNHFSSDPPEFISLHSQESMEEEELMRERKGRMADWLAEKGHDLDSLPSVNRSSLVSVIEFLPAVKRILLVHNTFVQSADIQAVTSKYLSDQVFWVLCPNSNLYIENSLPENLISNRKGLQICLGTDSLASNSSLSLLEEMKTIQRHFPFITLEEIIEWATLNGAKAIGVESQFGSFKPGQKPGLVLIDGINHDGLCLTSASQSKRLA